MSKENEKATVLRTTKVRTKLKDDGSWVNRSDEPEAETEEKPWMAELRARRENAASTETSPVASPSSAPLTKSDSDKGVATKLDKPASSSTSNGISSGTSQITKRSSEGYKKIAPQIVKPATDNMESEISSEEQEKRTTAASQVLPKSAARERSYVLSAAKKFESQMQAADTSVPNGNPSFVAKRVKIADEAPANPPPLIAELPPAVASVTSVALVPEPQPQNIVSNRVKTAAVNATQKVEVFPPEPALEDLPLPPPPPPLPMLAPENDPELIPDYLHVISTRSQLDDSDADDTFPEPLPEPEPETSEHSSFRVETLNAMYENLIPFETETTSFKDDEPVLAEEEEDPGDAGSEEGREEPAQPVLPGSGRWSQDLLTELESHTETVTITTQTVTSVADSKKKDPVSSRVTTTVTEFSSADPFDPYPIGTTSPNSSSDLLQPISDLSINSSSTSFVKKQDSTVKMSSRALEALGDDIIPPINGATSLSTHRSWAHTWKTTTPLQTHIEEREAPEEDREEDQQTLVMFERKSKENDSPWDRWTSPSVYTVTTTTEEEESPEDLQTHTFTSITTVRETYAEQEELGMDRPVLQEVQRTPTPEPESKKPMVYVKEYVNSSHNATDTMNSWSSSYSSSLSSPCTYCGQLVGNDAKITIEHLNINSHPSCFKCHSCRKPMGDLLYNMFLNGGKVHCESCYAALD